MKETNKTSSLAIWLPILTGIVAVFLTIFYNNTDNRRDIQITNVRVMNLIYPAALYENRHIDSTWEFMDTFSNGSVYFHAENHSEFDVEIYGFYLEVQVEDLAGDRIMIPLNTTFIGQDTTISPAYGDWEATTEIEKCTLNALVTYESTADIASTISGGPATWYLSSDWAEEDHVLHRINKNASKNKPIDLKARIVCKDSFGDFYYSDWVKRVYDPSSI